MAFLFAATLLLSAALLMLVQPMAARLVLPYLGGAPSVWNTCMLFFQAGLLVGYGYAHLVGRSLGKSSVVVHVVLLALGFWMLPMELPRPESAPTMPVVWLLGALVTGVALPYAVLAGTAPLLQRWFAAANFGNPYFLYAASNAGSFLGLLAYPFLVEPWLTLQEQAVWWRWSFAALGLLSVGCAATLLTARSALTTPSALATPSVEIPWRQRLHWLLLAVVPSSLLLSVTNTITTDIAAVPLLWIVPLSLYLLSFTIVFASRQLISLAVLARWQPMALIAVALVLLRGTTEPLGLVITIHLLAFFWVALVCHGELARTKPSPEHLTEFYLWLALGGVLGGAFNTLIAPHLFSGYAEYPLMLALAAALGPRLEIGSQDAEARSRQANSDLQDTGPGEQSSLGGFALRVFKMLTNRSAPDLLIAIALAGVTAGLILLGQHLGMDPALSALLSYGIPLVVCYTLHTRPVRFGLGLAAVFLASLLDPGIHGQAAYRTRSFFGVHRVTEKDGMRHLVHGNIVHGRQFLDPRRRREPLTYYHRTGPIGRLLAALEKDARLKRVGLVGLGAGSLASYAQPGQRWTFFEIDPTVVHIARDTGLFTFLGDSRGDIQFVIGDARLTLERSSEEFGLLVVDAFGSDAIPWHLLTREAMELYRARVEGRGILAFHISNRYVDLEPVLANHAKEMNWSCVVAEDLDSREVREYPGKAESSWVFLAEPGALPALSGVSRRPGRPDPNLRAWTDDYVNLLEVLRWRTESP